MTRLIHAPLDASPGALGLELVGTPDEVRRMDEAAIATWGIDGRVLMELAGAAATRSIRERLGGLAGKAVVLCGAGNNGGDGYVVARHLLGAGFFVRVIATGTPELGSDAEVNHRIWQALVLAAGDGSPRAEHRVAERGATARMRHWLGHANVVVDALFGTGLTRAVDGVAAELIEAANEARHGLKVALDLPSGLHGGTGQVLGQAFRADLTVTFGLLKRGLLLRDGPALSGEVEVVDIGWPRPAIDAVPTKLRRATEAAMARLVPKRQAEGHKGTFGHVGVIGGSAGLEGAAVLAARGAMRSGAGLVTWAAVRDDDDAGPTTGPGDQALERSPDQPIAPPPELMRLSIAANELPARATVLVVGPGLGKSEAAKLAVATSWEDRRPAVFDADALNLLAEAGLVPLAGQGVRVLTPHPLEAARLLETTAETIQADRVGAAERLAARFAGVIIVLKGARTLVAQAGEATVLIDLSEPTLAVGGTGDVLAGLIGGLMAQGVGAREAALCGVWVHGHAGREAGLDRGQRGAFASEIADVIPTVMSHLSHRAAYGAGD